MVLCQLLTGESLVSYRYSTSVKARVPHSARAVLDRCLGEAATPPLANCEGLAEAAGVALAVRRRASAVELGDACPRQRRGHSCPDAPAGLRGRYSSREVAR